MNRTILSALTFVGAAALSLGNVGCSSSDSKGDGSGGAANNGGSTSGGSTSTAGSTGTGGSTSAGGSTAKGGASGSAGSSGDPYTCAKRMPPDPGGTAKEGDSCC